jgi:protein pelota
MLGADSSRAFYGPGHVLAAAELGAIQTLLISGALVDASFMTASCWFARVVYSTQAAA